MVERKYAMFLLTENQTTASMKKQLTQATNMSVCSRVQSSSPIPNIAGTIATVKILRILPALMYSSSGDMRTMLHYYLQPLHTLLALVAVVILEAEAPSVSL